MGAVHFGVSEHEASSRAFRRSLFVVRDLRKGEKFTSDNIRSIRPGHGLHTRHLAEVLDTEIKRSERTGREFALLLFDLDGLKQINDRYGHLRGSHALCRVADVLSFCRDIDTAARYGGDEFAVVLPETGAEAANHAAQRICDSIANDGMEPALSVSIGVAVYPHDGESLETLLRAADVAMYSMKASRHKLLNA